MRFLCTNCAGILTIDESDLGQSLGCVHCGDVVAAPRARVEPGVIIGEFVIREQLKRGTNGTDFIAFQPSEERTVIVKIVDDSLARDPVYVGSFLKKAQSASGLNHPNVAAVYAMGQEDSLVFLARENVDGDSLQSVIAKEMKLEVYRASGVIMQLAKALEAAWEVKQLLHLNLKPDLIFLTSEDATKVADIALAQVVGSEPTDNIQGTPQYMSPESIVGDMVDMRGDIYSLGCIYYQLVTGVFPFAAATPVDILKKHLDASLESPRVHDADIPTGVCDIIGMMMAKEPDKRYPDHTNLIKDIQAVIRHKRPIHAPPFEEAWSESAASVVVEAEDPSEFIDANTYVGEVQAPPAPPAPPAQPEVPPPPPPPEHAEVPPPPPPPTPAEVPPPPPPVAGVEAGSDQAASSEAAESPPPPAGTLKRKKKKKKKKISASFVKKKPRRKQTSTDIGATPVPAVPAAAAIEAATAAQPTAPAAVATAPAKPAKPRRSWTGIFVALIIIGVAGGVLFGVYAYLKPNSVTDVESKYLKLTRVKAGERTLYLKLKEFLDDDSAKIYSRDRDVLVEVSGMCRKFMDTYPHSLFCAEPGTVDYGDMFAVPQFLADAYKEHGEALAYQVPKTFAEYEEALVVLLRDRAHDKEKEKIKEQQEVSNKQKSDQRERDREAGRMRERQDQLDLYEEAKTKVIDAQFDMAASFEYDELQAMLTALVNETDDFYKDIHMWAVTKRKSIETASRAFQLVFAGNRWIVGSRVKVNLSGVARKVEIRAFEDNTITVAYDEWDKDTEQMVSRIVTLGPADILTADISALAKKSHNAARAKEDLNLLMGVFFFYQKRFGPARKLLQPFSSDISKLLLGEMEMLE